MENQPSPPSPATDRRYTSLVLAAFFLCLLVGGGFLALRSARPANPLGCTEEQEPPPDSKSNVLADYAQWEKPLLAIVLSGQMHGYVNPCGCSHPQNGGLERRYNFIESLKAKSWNVIGIDLGELAEAKGIQEQNALKYDLSVKALRKMGYRALGIGRDEFRAGLEELLVRSWDDQKSPQHLLLSLADPDKFYHGLNVRPFEIVADTNPKLGIINMFGPDIRKEIEPKRDPDKPKFLFNEDELPKALDAFAAAGVDIGVILHHEYPKYYKDKNGQAVPIKELGPIQQMQKIEELRREEALKCAEFCAGARQKNAKVPPIQLVMMLIEDPEPPSFMMQLDPKLPTYAVEIGHKGKYVGLIGVYKDKEKGYRLQYQKVLMSEDWATPEAKKAQQPIIALMDVYQKEVKAQDLLAKAPRHLHFNQLPEKNQKGLKATYVGSARCESCHEHAHAVWSKSMHAKAMETLEKKPFPPNRQFDPECVKCHTTGFQHPGGYYDFVPNLAAWPAPPAVKPDAAQVAKHNNVLRGVGCESCHGPASEHVKNTADLAIRKLINPYRPTPAERILEDKLVKNPKDAKALQQWMQLSGPRRRAIEATCLKCHDQENDVHWGNEGKDIVARWLLDPKQRLIHHKPNNNGAGVAPKNDGDVAPAGNLEPPLEIEVVPLKKE